MLWTVKELAGFPCLALLLYISVDIDVISENLGHAELPYMKLLILIGQTESHSQKLRYTSFGTITNIILKVDINHITKAVKRAVIAFHGFLSCL